MPFQPGQVANPGGRPKVKPFQDALRLAIADADGDFRALRKVAEALVANAMKGDNVAIKEVADRLDGKVPQALIGGDEGSEPIALKVTWAND